VTSSAKGFELRRITLPLVSPFRTSMGVEHGRDVLLVRAVVADAEGWGECVAMSDPHYSHEYVDGAADVIRRFLIPAVVSARDIHVVEQRFAAVRGHPMAKAAVHTALLDARLRAAGMSMGEFLGAVRPTVPAGVSVGIMDDVGELLDAVAGYLDAGYVRIKLKIEPGWDVAPVAAVRDRFGDAVLLQVDANCAYTATDAARLSMVDDFGLLLIEQPFPEDDIAGHARLAASLRTPICLDESITSARVAAQAIGAGACSVVNIKPGRVGGYLEARRIHDVCAAHGVPAWIGGMLETGVGRAANAALAALPGCTLPGDISASNRYYARDITTPFVLRDGHITVPTGPGIGVDVDDAALAEVTTATEWIPAR
jgi:o-succinylbenzoate synthase